MSDKHAEAMERANRESRMTLAETLHRVEQEVSRRESRTGKPRQDIRGVLWKQSGGKQSGGPSSSGSRISFGNLMAKWDKRFFVLLANSTTLKYYRSEQDAKAGADEAGSIELRGCQVRRLLRREGGSHDGAEVRHDDPFVVESFVTKRALTVRAEAPGHAAAGSPGALEWIEALVACGGYVVGATAGSHFDQLQSARASDMSARAELPVSGSGLATLRPSFRQGGSGHGSRHGSVSEVETMEAAQLRESYARLRSEYDEYKAHMQKEVGNLREEVRLLRHHLDAMHAHGGGGAGARAAAGDAAAAPAAAATPRARRDSGLEITSLTQVFGSEAVAGELSAWSTTAAARGGGAAEEVEEDSGTLVRRRRTSSGAFVPERSTATGRRQSTAALQFYDRASFSISKADPFSDLPDVDELERDEAAAKIQAIKRGQMVRQQTGEMKLGEEGSAPKTAPETLNGAPNGAAA